MRGARIRILPVVQPGASDVLGALRAEWRRVSRGSQARAVVAHLRTVDAGVLPPGVVDLHDLVCALEPRGGLTPERRAEIVGVLLGSASEPLVRRCLLQTLLPGIVAVARRLQFGAGIADDPRTFLADALAEAAELLAAWSGERRRYAAPDLLNALRCRLRRRMLGEKRRRGELVADERRLDGRAREEGSLVRALAAAIDRGVTDVDLVYARCVLDASTASLARSEGVSTKVMQRRLVAAAAPFIGSSS